MNNILKIILDQKEYYIKIIVLFIFWKIIKKHPKLKEYKPETAFSVYRSLMCLFFMLFALENLINNFTDLFNQPYATRECYSDITSWFIVYLIMDVLKMILDKNKRIDLYIHHIWCLFVAVSFKYYGISCSMVNLILINEAISIVSGLDLMAMEDNKMKESYYYKVYRKSIIRYIRLPIWILGLLFTIRHTHQTIPILWWISTFTCFLMIGMDHYWEKKCDKVINKYSEK